MDFEGKTIRNIDLPHVGRVRIVDFDEIDNRADIDARAAVRGITREELMDLMREVVSTNVLDEADRVAINNLGSQQIIAVHREWMLGSRLK
jgi:hypothetical protein